MSIAIAPIRGGLTDGLQACLDVVCRARVPRFPGRRLIGAGPEPAQDAGLSCVELTVRAGSARAIALYPTMGFATEGRKRRAMLVDGTRYDLIAMVLLFDDRPPRCQTLR